MWFICGGYTKLIKSAICVSNVFVLASVRKFGNSTPFTSVYLYPLHQENIDYTRQEKGLSTDINGSLRSNV